MSKPKGLILFAHGARDPRWAAPFESVAAQVRQAQPQLQLRLAYLEFMQPGLEAAAQDLVAAGCQDVAILPMFLGAGGHIQNDLPRLVQALRERWPNVQLSLHRPVGELPSVSQAMAQAAIALAQQAQGGSGTPA